MMRYRRNKYAIDSIKKLREQERMAATANVDTSVTIPSKMLLAVSARPRMGNTRGRQLAIASKKIRKEEMAATRKSTNVAAPVGDVHVDAGVSARYKYIHILFYYAFFFYRVNILISSLCNFSL